MSEVTYLSVGHYIDSQSVEAVAALAKLRNTIQQFFPDGEECISYQIPTVKYKGQHLVAYAAFKEHYKFYLMSRKLMTEIAEDIRSFNTSDVTICIAFNQNLPVGLVKKVLLVRKKEIELLIRYQLLK